MRIFAGDRVRAIMERLKMPDGEAIEAGIVTRSIESAQRKVEGRNFDIRKQLLEYDDVSNDQRKVIYQQRNDILDASALGAQIAALREGCFEDLVHQYVPPESVEEQWDLKGLEKVLAGEWGIELGLAKQVEAAASMTDEDIVEKVVAAAHAAFAPRWNRSARRTSPISSAWCCCKASTRTGANTWPRWTTCARASTCAATPRSSRSRNTSARPSSCSARCWTR
jgi:preprotein translocase subunit SecA